MFIIMEFSRTANKSHSVCFMIMVFTLLLLFFFMGGEGGEGKGPSSRGRIIMDKYKALV